MRTLYGIQQSPWTQRARWALEHHGVTFRYREHVPMVGEPRLRHKARTNKPTVPLLLDGSDPIMGSFAIARRSESIGRGAPLFPRHGDADVEHWSELAERMTRVGRSWLFRNLAASRAAQRESLPSFLPGLLAPAAGLAVTFLAKKYVATADPDAEVTHVLRPALAEVRSALAGRPYLLGTFSYADVAVATALQVVRPHDLAPLGPATRAAWSNDALAAEFEDLLQWRDAVYRKHR